MTVSEIITAVDNFAWGPVLIFFIGLRIVIFYCVKIPPDQTFQANAELFIQKQKSKFRFNSIPGFIYCYWWPCRNR